MAEAGWVFRLEIVTKKPATTTKEIMEEIGECFAESPKIARYLLEEIVPAEIKLFKRKEATGK